jgi:hypothetical protein
VTASHMEFGESTEVCSYQSMISVMCQQEHPGCRPWMSNLGEIRGNEFWCKAGPATILTGRSNFVSRLIAKNNSSKQRERIQRISGIQGQ